MFAKLSDYKNRGISIRNENLSAWVKEERRHSLMPLVGEH